MCCGLLGPILETILFLVITMGLFQFVITRTKVFSPPCPFGWVIVFNSVNGLSIQNAWYKPFGTHWLCLFLFLCLYPPNSLGTLTFSFAIMAEGVLVPPLGSNTTHSRVRALCSQCRVHCSVKSIDFAVNAVKPGRFYAHWRGSSFKKIEQQKN